MNVLVARTPNSSPKPAEDVLPPLPGTMGIGSPGLFNLCTGTYLVSLPFLSTSLAPQHRSILGGRISLFSPAPDCPLH